jgi:hypothetical protein
MTFASQWAAGLLEGDVPLRRFYTVKADESEGEGVTQKIVEIKSRRRFIRPASDAGQKVDKWKARLNTTLGDRLGKPIEWPEEYPKYFTDKLGWNSYNALVLWAAYDEHPELMRPLHLPDSLSDDPAYKRNTDPSFNSRYVHLLGVELWLPGLEHFNFNLEDPAGTKVRVGFTTSLLIELERLNLRTWKADDEEISAWEEEEPEAQAPLEECAKFGFGIFHWLTTTAVRHGLPMLLDF